MALDKETTRKKYADIRIDYQKWTNKKYKGARMYTDAYIFQKLKEKFYLSPSTIEDIVYHRVNIRVKK